MPNTKYKVTYSIKRDGQPSASDQIARFAHHDHAQRFAQMVSVTDTIWGTQGFAEVRAKDGLIGQWQDGLPTDEFRHLRDLIQ